MVVHCISFGSLSWLRPGIDVSDCFRFSEHAAAFNTTGFARGSRERRFWHTPGVLRMNVAQHHGRIFQPGSYQTTGIEKRGEWTRMLLGRRVSDGKTPDGILQCLQSGTIGRLNFESRWHSGYAQIIAGSAFHGEQETLVIGTPGAVIMTDKGQWEVTWTGLSSR